MGIWKIGLVCSDLLVFVGICWGTLLHGNLFPLQPWSFKPFVFFGQHFKAGEVLIPAEAIW